MNMINEQVYHSQFGTGTIVNQTVTMITVRFSEEVGIKKFLYPSAFESFLILCNPTLKEMMDSELMQLRERTEEEKRKRAEEDKKHREVKLLEQKHTITKKRTSGKKTLAKPKMRKETENVPPIEKDTENSGEPSVI